MSRAAFFDCGSDVCEISDTNSIRNELKETLLPWLASVSTGAAVARAAAKRRRIVKSFMAREENAQDKIAGFISVFLRFRIQAQEDRMDAAEADNNKLVD